MTSGFDQAGTTTQGNDLASLRAASALPPMTPETARRLAAILAPHLVAMRAVTAGTRYEGCLGESGAGEGGIGESGTGEGAAGAGDGPTADPGSISPATKIFIAGMLDRISA